MPSIEIRIPIEPVPFARAGSHGKRRFTPTRQANFMSTIRLFADRAMAGRLPFEGALSLTATFMYVTPTSWSKKKRAATIWKTSVPDADNCAKICLDSMKSCVFIDDAQIAEMIVRKRYGEKPGVEIIVSTLDESMFGA
jgi:Holliday junction resolvase RusA-like endonuclease